MTSPYFADLSGTPVIACALAIPLSGMWHVDLVLDSSPPAVVGPQVLTLAGSTWSCAPIRVIAFAGRTEARLVAGNAGWRTTVTAKQYQSPGGVVLSMVLGDLAALVQETPPVLDPSLAPTVGAGYVRQAGVASLVLQDLLGDAWWTDPTGVVQTSARPPTPITSPFTVESVHGASGRYLVATETPADWIPGATFTGPTASGTVNLVRHVLSESGFRTEIMVSP